MERARRIVVVAHCLLNVNSRVEGLARYPGVHPVIAELARRGHGIEQLPCPKAARALSVFATAGCAVESVAGVDGRPRCGVALTSGAAEGGGSDRIPGCGVFMRALQEHLAPLGAGFVGVDGRDAGLGVSRVLAALGEG